ncbi:MAG: DUF5320 domain-containing protein [Spirochaetes bacterium]|nr:DUF5320 domain-containing protein [Spirochaetota bacterium]
MPAGNGTGPSGFGPMTGRAAGFCAGYSVPGYVNPVRGRTFGFARGGRGGGRGWRNQYYATGMPRWARGGYYPDNYGYGYPNPAPVPEMNRETEMKMLKEQSEFIQKEMSAIQDRIKELENQASE